VLRVLGIVGYKDSGKTTLVRLLAQELIDRGHQVAVVKHTHHRLDPPGKDTAVLRDVAAQVGVVSPYESALMWRQPLSLEDILPYLAGDIVLVEGFKTEQTFPKIACLRGEPDDLDLFDGLVLCAVGPSPDVMIEGTGVPFVDRDDVGGIADLVEGKGFKLPKLDCGGCGHERCYDLAREIVAGAASAADCVSLEPATEVRIDGELLALNPFISQMVRNTILGLLSPLKGVKSGGIEIHIE
jgi:molybdopterin-guanine dinucleotide biosynthesis protein B